MNEEKVSGFIVDIHDRVIFPGEVLFQDGRISMIRKVDDPVSEQYILPGFIDAHIHIESSMMVPSEFARLAVRHGTVSSVSDPHEIGNVLGVQGVDYMIKTGIKYHLSFILGHHRVFRRPHLNRLEQKLMHRN